MAPIPKTVSKAAAAAAAAATATPTTGKSRQGSQQKKENSRQKVSRNLKKSATSANPIAQGSITSFFVTTPTNKTDNQSRKDATLKEDKEATEKTGTTKTCENVVEDTPEKTTSSHLGTNLPEEPRMCTSDNDEIVRENVPENTVSAPKPVAKKKTKRAVKKQVPKQKSATPKSTGKSSTTTTPSKQSDIVGNALESLVSIVERAGSKSVEWILCEFQDVHETYSKKQVKEALKTIAVKKKVPEKGAKPVWTLVENTSVATECISSPTTSPMQDTSHSTPVKSKGSITQFVTPVSAHVQRTSKGKATPTSLDTKRTKSNQKKAKVESSPKPQPVDPQHGKYASLLAILLKRVAAIGLSAPIAYEQDASNLILPKLVADEPECIAAINAWTNEQESSEQNADMIPIPLIAMLIQGSALTLSELVDFVNAKLGVKINSPELANRIQLAAERKCYGKKGKKNVVAADDTEIDAVWRWEVANIEVFSSSIQKELQQVRKDRRMFSAWVSCVCRTLHLMEQPASDAVKTKIDQQIEKSLKYQRQEEVQRQKLADQAKKREKRLVEEQERARLKKEAEMKKEEQKAENARIKAEREAIARLELEKEEERKKKLSLMRFFSKPTTSKPDDVDRATKSSTSQNNRSNQDEIGHSQQFQESFEKGLAQQQSVDYLLKLFLNCTTEAKQRRVRQSKLPRFPPQDVVDNEDRMAVAPPASQAQGAFAFDTAAEERSSRDSAVAQLSKRCLFQFHENRRPAYFGTFRKRSTKIRPRAPLMRDEKLLDYNVDSDEEWEEPEDGESLSDGDGSEDGEPEDLDYGDGWLMPDDAVIVSEDENDLDDDDNVQGVVGELGAGRNKLKRCQMARKAQSFEVIVVGVQTDETLISTCDGPSTNQNDTASSVILHPKSKVIDVPISNDYRLLQYYKVQRNGRTSVQVDSLTARNAALHPPITATPQKRRKPPQDSDMKENATPGSNKKHKATTPTSQQLKKGKKRVLEEDCDSPKQQHTPKPTKEVTMKSTKSAEKVLGKAQPAIINFLVPKKPVQKFST